MTRFQHLAVTANDGPHVTLLAGVDLAGRFWATTSASAAKVRMIRSRPRTAVLRSDDAIGGWTLTAGHAVILDARRPCDVLADPMAIALSGIALGRIGLANADQLIGYFDDRGAVPDRWSLTSRVLLVVHNEHQLTWQAGQIVGATGAFADADRVSQKRAERGRRWRSGAFSKQLCAGLSPHQTELVRRPGPCAVGLSTTLGPVVVPGLWHPDDSSVRLDPGLLTRLRAIVPGPCSVTLDDSHVARPSMKVGVMLRGTTQLMTNDLLFVHAARVTSWDGFLAATTNVA